MRIKGKQRHGNTGSRSVLESEAALCTRTSWHCTARQSDRQLPVNMDFNFEDEAFLFDSSSFGLENEVNAFDAAVLASPRFPGINEHEQGLDALLNLEGWYDYLEPLKIGENTEGTEALESLRVSGRSSTTTTSDELSAGVADMLHTDLTHKAFKTNRKNETKPRKPKVGRREERRRKKNALTAMLEAKPPPVQPLLPIRSIITEAIIEAHRASRNIPISLSPRNLLI
mmetsp:Transcript_18568/g.18650  ORF Transcript_18568/g.18650 Transcript_18568/m.18650 type:complete len:228 (+) Transcript_18568:83-766(+)